MTGKSREVRNGSQFVVRSPRSLTLRRGRRSRAVDESAVESPTASAREVVRNCGEIWFSNHVWRSALLGYGIPEPGYWRLGMVEVRQSDCRLHYYHYY